MKKNNIVALTILFIFSLILAEDNLPLDFKKLPQIPIYSETDINFGDDSPYKHIKNKNRALLALDIKHDRKYQGLKPKTRWLIRGINLLLFGISPEAGTAMMLFNYSNLINWFVKTYLISVLFY